jgi:hypothetical protein
MCGMSTVVAALIQRVLYAGAIASSGLFAILQSFGALAVISPPGVIAIGVTVAVVGVGILGYFGYKLWNR